MTLLDATGRPTPNSKKFVKKESVPRSEHNLGPEDIARLDFHPFGTRVIIEAVAPDTSTESGVVMPFGGDDKPFYRILRWGSPEYTEQITKVARLGDMIFTRAIKALQVFHQFPRLEQDGITHDREILMLDYSAIDGTISGYAWNNPEAAERKVGSMPIADFKDDFVNSVTTDMISLEDCEKIDFEPLSDKIVVERAPKKTKEGSLFLPELGQSPLPIFRVVKMPANNDNLAPHLKGVRVGDLLLITNVNPMTDDFPTSLKDRYGNKRELYLTSANYAIGWWPSLSYRNLSFNSSSLSDQCKSQETLG